MFLKPTLCLHHLGLIYLLDTTARWCIFFHIWLDWHYVDWKQLGKNLSFLSVHLIHSLRDQLKSILKGAPHKHIYHSFWLRYLIFRCPYYFWSVQLTFIWRSYWNWLSTDYNLILKTWNMFLVLLIVNFIEWGGIP